MKVLPTGMIVTTYLHELNNEIWLQLPFEEANYWSSYISWLGSSLFSLASEFSSEDKHKITINFVNQYQLRFPSPNQWSHKPTAQFLSVNWYTIGSWLLLRELNNCESLLCCGQIRIIICNTHYALSVVSCMGKSMYYCTHGRAVQENIRFKSGSIVLTIGRANTETENPVFSCTARPKECKNIHTMQCCPVLASLMDGPGNSLGQKW